MDFETDDLERKFSDAEALGSFLKTVKANLARPERHDEVAYSLEVSRELTRLIEIIKIQSFEIRKPDETHL